MTFFRSLLATALSACLSGPVLAQSQEAVGLGELPPIVPSYKAEIVAWSRFFFADAGPIRAARISDPLLMRDSTGRLLWLVCLDAEAQASSGRYAIGFAPGFFSAPRQRSGSSLVNGICDEHPLTYRPFAELTRGAAPVRRGAVR